MMTLPLLSVAVGSLKFTCADVVPTSTIRVNGVVGQFTTGGSESTEILIREMSGFNVLLIPFSL